MVVNCSANDAAQRWLQLQNTEIKQWMSLLHDLTLSLPWLPGVVRSNSHVQRDLNHRNEHKHAITDTSIIKYASTLHTCIAPLCKEARIHGLRTDRAST